MKKKMVIGLFLTVLITGGVFARDAKNWVYGQIGLINVGVGYERTLTPVFSVGGEVYWNTLFFFWNSVATEAYAKIYPFKGNFYAKVGLGYGTVTGTEIVERSDGTEKGWVYTTKGFMIDPGLGWKIDVGKPGAFFIEPKLSVPIVLGKKTYDATGYKENGEFKVGTNFVVSFGMGYAF